MSSIDGGIFTFGTSGISGIFGILGGSGSVKSGLGIVDVMDYITCDIKTINTGMAASMGSILLGAGTSTDMYMTHTGGNSFLYNGTGNLSIVQQTNDGDLILMSDDGSGGETAYITLDGSATQTHLHQDTVLTGGKKLYLAGNTYITEASSDILDFYVGGVLLMKLTETGDGIEFPQDSHPLKIGAGSDLQLNHNGTDSFVENYTGQLNIINNTDDGDIIFKSDDGSGGIETYLMLDGSDESVRLPADNKKLKLGSGTGMLSLYHNGTDARIDNAVGSLRFFNYGDDSDITFNTDDGSGGTATYLTLDGSEVRATFDVHTRFNGTGEFRDKLYIAHGGSDYAPNISFLGGSDVAGSNASENAGIGYYDNSGTGTMLFFGNRAAMNWTFKDDGDTLFHMASGGTFHANADVVAYSSTTSSDKRLKENINPIPYGLEEVLKMNPVEYDWKEKRNKAHDIGVIAQELEKIIPEVVQENKDLNSDKMIKGVDYGKMVAVLIKAIQEQQEEIELLKANYDDLKYNRR